MKRYKNIKRMSRILYVILLLSMHLNAQQECATMFNTPQERAAWMQRHLQYENAKANKVMAPTTTKKWIPVALHIVRQTNGTGGISLLDTRLALERCNTAFINTNIRFYECNSEFIDVDSLYDFNKATDEVPLVSTRLIDGAVNVFVVNSIITGGQSACGYANFPGTIHPGYGNNFILMQIGCMNSPSQTTLQHEFGHFFDLKHTFDTGSGAELVTRDTGANCPTAGDGFCDTPADPNVWAASTCTYTGTGTDANGDTYAPDPSNIMTYSFKPCRINFSQEQIDKMNLTVSDSGSADRNSLSCTNCLQLLSTSLPDNQSGSYLLDEYYTYGNYFNGKLVMSQITSDINLNTVSVVGSNLKLIATTSVTFLPGFAFDAATAQLGELTAIADACGGTGNKNPATVLSATEPFIKGSAGSFRIYPNPFNNSFTLKMNLDEDASVSISVFDVMGKMIDHIAQSQNMLKGMVQFDYNSEKLTPGMYVCVIDVNGERFTERIVKM